MKRAVLAGLVLAAAVTASRAAATPAAVHIGCPPADLGSPGATTLEQAVAVARRAVIRGQRESIQGKTYVRTKTSYPVIGAVELDGNAAGAAALRRTAVHRCGKAASRYLFATWNVTFTDTDGLIATFEDPRFVVRLTRGWWVY